LSSQALLKTRPNMTSIVSSLAFRPRNHLDIVALLHLSSRVALSARSIMEWAVVLPVFETRAPTRPVEDDSLWATCPEHGIRVNERGFAACDCYAKQAGATSGVWNLLYGKILTS
jgi:hypothetical protein